MKEINITDLYGQAHSIDLDNLGNQALRMDCMELMKALPDKCFELAIVDPPYGIDAGTYGCGSRERKYDRSNAHNWDSASPPDVYWSELFRVSQNQIIWGMNNFNLPPCKHFIVWDKKQPDGVTFAQAEISWTSFNGTSVIFRQSSIGQDDRIHPCQKPVALYDWLLSRYAHKGDRILDTHLGSGSSRIAAWQAGYNLLGCEIDKDYYEQGCKRYESYACQYKLF